MLTFWEKKYRAEELTAESEVAVPVPVPALPYLLYIELQPSETVCVIHRYAAKHKYNASEVVTCAKESACSCAVCMSWMLGDMLFQSMENGKWPNSSNSPDEMSSLSKSRSLFFGCK